MAGWLLVCHGSTSGDACSQRWQESRSLLNWLVADSVVEKTEISSAKIQLAAWRRESGEYAGSGRIVGDERAASIAGVVWQDTREATDDFSLQMLSNLGHTESCEATLQRTNGEFSFVMLDKAAERAVIATDRFGHYPVYMVNSGEWLVFSTELLLLRPWLRNPQLNRPAVDLFLRTGELIDSECLLEGISVVRGGRIISIEKGKQNRSTYWSPLFNSQVGIRKEEACERIGHALRTAVQRLEGSVERIGITLSGGLDSRLLLDLCKNPWEVPSFTWGEPGCRDLTCASSFASLVKSPHVARHWNPDDFPPLWMHGVLATGGGVGVDSMYMLPFSRMVARSADCVLNGLAGDALLGGNFLKAAWFQIKTTQELASRSWQWRVSEGTDSLVDQLFSKTEKGAAQSAWKNSICAEIGSSPLEILNQWLIKNRVFCHTNCGTMLLRRHVESYSPFFDAGVFDALSLIPLGWKSKHRLYLQLLSLFAPRSCRITWQRTGLPPGFGFYFNLFSMFVHRIGGSVGGLLGVDLFPKLPVAHLKAWMSRKWQRSIAGVLFSESLKSRNLYCQQSLHRMYSRMQSGHADVRQIGAIVTVELLAKAMIDNDLELPPFPSTMVDSLEY